jgi:small subunit ribosomal protein S1
MLDESNTLQNEDTRRTSGASNGGDASRSQAPDRRRSSSAATATSDDDSYGSRRGGGGGRDRDRDRDRDRGRRRGRGQHRSFEDDEEERRPKRRTPVAQIQPINFDFDDADTAPMSRDQFMQAVLEYEETLKDFDEGEIVRGRIVGLTETEVLVDIGFKSDGTIPRAEFIGVDGLEIGTEFDVYLDKMENQDGLIVLSKTRADFLRVWDRIKAAFDAQETVKGTVDRRIKGGLVAKLYGVDAFLPGSQVALRQVPNLDTLIGNELEFRIIKLNKRRRNIVVSRRVVLEEQRAKQKSRIMEELDKGQVRKGVVKNITDFGAFVDLGGIDGLLHLTDLWWGRVAHPSEVVQIGQ